MKSPKDLYKLLDNHVIGQHEAKKALSIAVFNHLAKFEAHLSGIDIKTRTNLLILGPTGCGKTYLMETLKKHLWVPIFTVNAMDISRSGYVGTNISDFLDGMIEEIRKEYVASDVAKLANRSIVFIDEIDKICLPSITSGGNDHNKEMQQQMLTFVEGLTHIEGMAKNNKQSSKALKICTHDMLFIFGGNFQELKGNLEKKQSKQTIGFVQESEVKDDLFSKHKKLVAMGMQRELAGRISVIAEVNKLSKQELKAALLNPKNGALAQYEKLYNSLGHKLKLSPYYISKIVDICYASDIGARGLYTALEEILNDKSFNLRADRSIIVTTKELENEQDKR